MYNQAWVRWSAKLSYHLMKWCNAFHSNGFLTNTFHSHPPKDELIETLVNCLRKKLLLPKDSLLPLSCCHESLSSGDWWLWLNIAEVNHKSQLHSNVHFHWNSVTFYLCLACCQVVGMSYSEVSVNAKQKLFGRNHEKLWKYRCTKFCYLHITTLHPEVKDILFKVLSFFSVATFCPCGLRVASVSVMK